MSLRELFNRFDDDYLEFDQVKDKFSNRPDLHAFILLDRLVPGDVDMVSSSAHDEFYLSVDPDALAAVATEDDIHDLVRCGVRYDEKNSSLCMFA
jgi:hypothetical protein